jgi:hypothetical protein
MLKVFNTFDEPYQGQFDSIKLKQERLLLMKYPCFHCGLYIQVTNLTLIKSREYNITI